MKFKAVWKPDACPVAAPAIQSVLRDSTSERTTVKLTPQKFFFTSLTRRKDQSESWVVLDKEAAFTSVVCESLRANEIDLAVSTESLLMVLKYVGQAVFCAMRLTRRESEPVLRFEFNFVDAGNSLVIHDVPVEVLRSEFVWSEPALPDPDAKIVLTQSTKQLAHFVDRIKHMGVSEVKVVIENRGSIADLKLTGVCDAVRTTVCMHKQPLVIDGEEQVDSPDVTQVHLTLTGLLFLLSRLSAPTLTNRCILMASEDKYVSAWVALPNRFGSMAAVTPAIITD